MSKVLKRGMRSGTAIGLTLLLWSASALAEAELEHQIRSQPMTHQGINGGKALRVHWAHLQGSLMTKATNANTLASYQQAISRCLQDGAKPGYVLDPPQKWPDQLEGLREDHYAAERYQITYSYSWTYGVDGAHCSLPATERRTATLRSDAGQCDIDLVEKTASGECDIAKHQRAGADVKPDPRTSSAGLPPGLEALLPRPLGLTKTVAGLSCEIFEHRGRKLCATAAGSFQTFYLRPNRRFSLLLEDIGPAGDERHAETAALDASVGEDIFTPYLRGGYRINADGDDP